MLADNHNVANVEGGWFAIFVFEGGMPMPAVVVEEMEEVPLALEEG